MTKTLTGDLTATDKGVVTATLSGTYTGDAVASDAGTLSLRAGAAEGNLTSTGSGSILTATVSGAAVGDASAAESGNLTLTTGSLRVTLRLPIAVLLRQLSAIPLQVRRQTMPIR